MNHLIPNETIGTFNKTIDHNDPFSEFKPVYSLHFIKWYSGMTEKQIKAAYERYCNESQLINLNNNSKLK